MGGWKSKYIAAVLFLFLRIFLDVCTVIYKQTLFCEYKTVKEAPHPPTADPPVNAGLCVDDLVQTGDLESVGVTPLTFIHEITECQHHLQDLSQTLTPDHLHGCIQDGWWETETEIQLGRSFSEGARVRPFLLHNPVESESLLPLLYFTQTPLRRRKPNLSSCCPPSAPSPPEFPTFLTSRMMSDQYSPQQQAARWGNTSPSSSRQ